MLISKLGRIFANKEYSSDFNYTLRYTILDMQNIAGTILSVLPFVLFLVIIFVWYTPDTLILIGNHGTHCNL